MTELRNIKLDLLMGNQNPVVDLFHKITDGLSIISCRVYNEEDDGQEFIYYNADNEWIFYQNSKKPTFWCNYKRYWSLFQLGYDEIQAVTKYLVEETLKREAKRLPVMIPFMLKHICVDLNVSNSAILEEALRRELATPYSYGDELVPKLGKALRQELEKHLDARAIESSDASINIK